MGTFRRLPVAMQTVYAELVERTWTGSFREIMDAGGTPHLHTVNGRGYWYWHPATRNGRRPSAKYLGPDTPELRSRIEARLELAEARKDWIGMVRVLRAGGMPASDGLSGTGAFAHLRPSMRLQAASNRSDRTSERKFSAAWPPTQPHC